MHNYLAIDAGGTATRAVLLTAFGTCLGYGIAGGGNPVSRGFESSTEALLTASKTALGNSGTPIHSVTVAMAGASLDLTPKPLNEGLRTLGAINDVMIESDLLATFYSGSHQDSGHALVAGTGAVAARVEGSQLASVADGAGWLLGDSGAGFWLGREVVHAVAAALDGRGQPTALAGLLTSRMGIREDPTMGYYGRSGTLQQLISKVYALAPIELSQFAPLAFEASEDQVARDILDRAAAALAGTLLATMDGNLAGPLVFGGSVLTKGPAVAQAVMAEVARRLPYSPQAPVLVHDGVVGAAVLALKRHGVTVDATVFARITSSLAALRE